METWSFWLNKLGILPCCTHVSITVWLFYLDSMKTREKARREQHKNAAYYFKPILEAAIYKTTAVQPLTSHLTNHPSKMSKTYCTLLNHWWKNLPHILCLLSISTYFHDLKKWTNRRKQLNCPVGWGYRIHWLLLCRGVKTLPMSVLWLSQLGW